MFFNCDTVDHRCSSMLSDIISIYSGVCCEGVIKRRGDHFTIKIYTPVARSIEVLDNLF